MKKLTQKELEDMCGQTFSLDEINRVYPILKKSLPALTLEDLKKATKPVDLTCYDISDINFIGKNLKVFIFKKSDINDRWFARMASLYNGTAYDPKKVKHTIAEGIHKAIFHEDPEVNATIVKMLLEQD